MKKFVVGPTQERHVTEDNAVTIANYPHKGAQYCQVWVMSKRDVLNLYHRLGDYLVNNPPFEEPK